MSTINLALGASATGVKQCSDLRPPAVGSRHHPLRVDEGASTEVVVHEQEGGLILDGVG